MRRHFLPIVVLLLLFGVQAFGQAGIADQPAFAATPDALRSAFAGIEPGANGASVLLEEARYEFDAAGLYTLRHRTIFKVLTKEAAEAWANIERSWSPWQEARPALRARVIAQDGTVHELDPATIAEAPVRYGDDDIVSDRRMLRAPLPALQPGAIVEQEIVERQTSLSLDAGTVLHFYLGYAVPVERTHLEIRVPQSVPLRFKAHLLPKLTVRDSSANGIRQLVFDQGPLQALEQPLPFLPSDEPRSPQIEFSTAKDWQTVAAGYAAIIEKQLKGFDATPFLPHFPPDASRDTKILSIMQKLNGDIRYTGVEFGEASVVPRAPAEVLQRKYGDCKDKATLAVALLRAAGIPAHVALLLSSEEEDIEPDLPGMDIFNHAIVYAPGTPDFWLDATDPDLRLRVISPPNQGRFSLIARPETAALMRTPELTADDNRVIETREFVLSELGRAKVIETSEAFGTPDRVYREAFGDKDQKALREGLKDYVESTYGEAKIVNITHGESSDLSKPFTLRLELGDAQRGTTARTEAAVGIFVSQIAGRLPRFFRSEPEKSTTPDNVKAPEVRTQDFAIPDAFTSEWRYKITAPPGFRIRQLPEAKAENIGPARLDVSFARESDTQVSGTLRFVMAKRRFSATDGIALRDAALELGKRKPILIYFDQVGETYLASGKVKEALAEFSSLRKLHPSEPLHSMQFARALLAAGAGESARAEARRAVALEPNSPLAYKQLAEILKNDLVGRPMESGLDRDGAIAAYRKALGLTPDDAETRANLAILLEYDHSAVRYGADARLDEAIVEYQKVLDKLASLGIPQNYPIALLRAGRMQDLKAYLLKQTDNDTNQTLLICAEAILNGSKAGIERASEISGVTPKQRILASAAQTLISIRRYGLAADLMEAAVAGTATPPAVANAIQVLRKTTATADGPMVLREPEDAVRMLLSRIAHIEAHQTDWTESFSSLMLADQNMDLKDVQRGMAQGRATAQAQGLSPEVSADLMTAAMQFSREGNDESGYVVRMSIPSGGKGAQNQVLFVVKENGSYRILAGFGDYTAVARLVLRLTDEGKLDQARLWLDRVRQETPAGSGDDPLGGSLFARLWQENQSADRTAIRFAAAVLLTGSSFSQTGGTIGILEEVRGGPDGNSSNIRTAALADAYFSTKRYAQALVASEALLSSVPQSGTALVLALKSAYASGGKKEAERIAGANLERFASNLDARRMAAAVAMHFGDTDRSNAMTQQIIDSGRGQAVDYNQLAWGQLMAGKATSTSMEMANKGILLDGNESLGLMHTVAAVDAELGKETDARQILLQMMKQESADEPNDNEWYVFGRIAEQYGLVMEAAGMYRKLEKPKEDFSIPASSYALAQKRLIVLGAQ